MRQMYAVLRRSSHRCRTRLHHTLWALMILSLISAVAQPAEQTGNNPQRDWLLPNLASRLTVKVTNHESRTAGALATVSVVAARQVAPDFPGRLAFVVLVDKRTPGSPATFLPSQVDDIDGDGTPDQLEFPVKLKAGEEARIDVYYSTTLDDTISWPKRVAAKHSYGYNRQVAALESELIGYRMYGGFFLDMQARLPDHAGLYNDLAAYVPPRLDLRTGRDVFHIGATLGIGGMFLRQQGRVYQPPMNVPDYAHQPSPAMVPHYRVVANGPLRAIVEASLDEWSIGNDAFRLKASIPSTRRSPSFAVSWMFYLCGSIPAKGMTLESGSGIWRAGSFHPPRAVSL